MLDYTAARVPDLGQSSVEFASIHCMRGALPKKRKTKKYTIKSNAYKNTVMTSLERRFGAAERMTNDRVNAPRLFSRLKA